MLLPMALSPRTRRWLGITALLVPLAGACILLAARGAATSTSVKLFDGTVRVRSLRGLTEVGTLDGAAYRIDMPREWNHKLVVYYHGYTQHVGAFHPQQPVAPEQQPLLDRHYAVAQSAYSEAGWALPQAFPETEALRQYFSRKFGQPLETYVAGRSMGGALVMITLELNPKPYLGGLDMCGSVGPSSQEFDRRFGQRAALDVFFPGLMPPLTQPLARYEANRAERERIAAALKRNPQAAAAMRSLIGLHNDAELASDMAYFTFVLADMEHRAGGNPFDNRSVVYPDLPGMRATLLNAQVRRYTPEPRARAYLLRHYTPTGRLGRPMLAVHTTYDPVVPVAQLAGYAEQVGDAGFSTNLAQQYVPRDGHCNITPAQIGTAFDELVRWTHAGPRPLPGLVPQSPYSPGLRQQALGAVPAVQLHAR